MFWGIAKLKFCWYVGVWLEKFLTLIISPLVVVSKKWASHIRRESSNKKKQFKETETLFSIVHTWSDNAFKATNVNQVLPSSLHRVHEITLTVPLIEKCWNLTAISVRDIPASQIYLHFFHLTMWQIKTNTCENSYC